jgi:hypothetical protein
VPPAHPPSERAPYADALNHALTEKPVRTPAEAVERHHPRTGRRRGLTQTRTSRVARGFTGQRSRAVPGPPKGR